MNFVHKLRHPVWGEGYQKMTLDGREGCWSGRRPKKDDVIYELEAKAVGLGQWVSRDGELLNKYSQQPNLCFFGYKLG
jgi:hypothetical protein